MENIYLTDSYGTEILTHVEEVMRVKGSPAVCLEKNIFYPGGGGQPPDKGSVQLASGENIPVERVLKQSGKVFTCLLTKTGIERGAELRASIDWSRRYSCMRYHTAAHLLMASIRAHTQDYEPQGIEIADDTSSCTLKFDGKWDDTEKNAQIIERTANAIVAENRHVESEMVQDLQSAILKYGGIYRGPQNLAGLVRMVVIPERDANPCGGTHVRSTSEVGHIRITSFSSQQIAFSLNQ